MGADQSSLVDYDPNDYIHDTVLDMNPMQYPNFGNYTLQRMPLKDLIDKPILEQMRFSDAITRRYAKNPIFIKQQFSRQLDYENLGNGCNETSIGNMAFMKYHNPDNQVIQEQYDKMAHALRNYVPPAPRIFNVGNDHNMVFSSNPSMDDM